MRGVAARPKRTSLGAGWREFLVRRMCMEALVGNTIARTPSAKRYRGHNAPPDHKFRIFISGQKPRSEGQRPRSSANCAAGPPSNRHRPLRPSTPWAHLSLAPQGDTANTDA